jgi:hypothetical protein
VSTFFNLTSYEQFDQAFAHPDAVFIGPTLAKTLALHPGGGFPPKLARVIEDQHRAATQDSRVRVPGAVACGHYRLAGGGPEVTVATGVFNGRLRTICVLTSEWG